LTGSEHWFVWTDFGGVLTPPIATSFAALCRRFGLDQVEVSTAMGKIASNHGVDDPLELLDRPLMTERDWICELNGHLNVKLPVETLADVWFDGRATNEAWVEALRQARSKGARIGMLSNMVPAWDLQWRRMVDPAELFEQIILSFEEGARKPEMGIFAAAERRADVSAARCVLVDDLKVNCEAAMRRGWQAIHFADAQSAEAQLNNIIAR
jgi:putative hydrolase of the HAD superfamily